MVQQKRTAKSPVGKRSKLTEVQTKRHKKPTREPIKSITNPVIQRMARKAGVKRVSSKVNDSVRVAIHLFLTQTIHDGVLYAQHSKRSTLTDNDVKFAFKRQGRTLYTLE